MTVVEPVGLMNLIGGVLMGAPDHPKIMSASAINPASEKVCGVVIVLNLEVHHDPLVAQHTKALLERLLLVNGPTESDEANELLVEAIAAITAENKVEITFSDEF